MDWEAQDDGFVAKILAEEGTKDVSVGSPVIIIVEEEVHCFPPECKLEPARSAAT